MAEDPASDLLTWLRKWEQIPYWEHLGIKVVKGRKGYAKLSLAFTDRLRRRNPALMHGGALASLVDAAVGAAVATLRESDDTGWSGQATLDLNISFLSAVHGRTVCFSDVDIRDEAGRLVAKGHATYLIVRR